MLTEGVDLKSTGAVNEDGVFESDILGMDLSYDVKKGFAKSALNVSTELQMTTTSLTQETEEPEVPYLYKYEDLDPRKDDLELTKEDFKKESKADSEINWNSELH